MRFAFKDGTTQRLEAGEHTLTKAQADELRAAGYGVREKATKNTDHNVKLASTVRFTFKDGTTQRIEAGEHTLSDDYAAELIEAGVAEKP